MHIQESATFSSWQLWLKARSMKHHRANGASVNFIDLSGAPEFDGVHASSPSTNFVARAARVAVRIVARLELSAVDHDDLGTANRPTHYRRPPRGSGSRGVRG